MCSCGRRGCWGRRGRCPPARSPMRTRRTRTTAAPRRRAEGGGAGRGGGSRRAPRSSTRGTSWCRRLTASTLPRRATTSTRSTSRPARPTSSGRPGEAEAPGGASASTLPSRSSSSACPWPTGTGWRSSSGGFGARPPSLQHPLGFGGEPPGLWRLRGREGPGGSREAPRSSFGWNSSFFFFFFGDRFPQVEAVVVSFVPVAAAGEQHFLGLSAPFAHAQLWVFVPFRRYPDIFTFAPFVCLPKWRQSFGTEVVWGRCVSACSFCSV